ncbi:MULTISPECIES: D-2-hydroxyacid dehydrogenase [Nocardiaceae]|uniref:D-2-hydroxyacid dehydrogenase n=1 Tax=Nocardiaceae TaxID=85025 RepID=UPI0003692ECD|nr:MULTISPECIES: D-2-hydroxyacid dehydrogenase [Rhodococcus]OZC85469.1 D-2-hydroxyacid dehydrogenase [Rhodococcus sp. 06-418-1B]OZD12807.1 D-2-hydroxyacid dehydrogenase [Rhodococcus sp. 06-156-4C]OZD24431.1 D-2-hydroxyacid dehydrogenase [Rhodococcus sp. 06-156-3C]OZD27541.1 D-2-hydroxyacid dehydrogenase [Rhodococcus sp. 06-156-4a]OZD37305.1 D-2-hydroxyacid dehydrogenase [Rhodococcus sp. 06-156-3b]
MVDKPVVVVLHADDLPVGMETVSAAAEVRYATADTLADAVPGADVLLLWDFFSSAVEQVWSRCDSLKWIHIAAAGVDSLMFDDLADSDVVVTNSRGIFDRPIAEYVLGQVLAFAKDAAGSAALQQRKEWRHRETERIDDAHAMVVGTGAIGREIGRVLRAVGMKVSGVGRTARSSDADFGVVHASSDLGQVVSDVDYLVLVAPLTDSTRGLVSADVLAATKPGVRVINVGRGELLDTEALLVQLRAGHIAGAALDVFEIEPLPADSPIWTTENLVVTPHMSGDARGWRERLSELFVANFDNYSRSADLVNVVDKKLGFVG